LECTVTVFRDLQAISAPSSSLPQHLGELLASQAGSDVTFKNVLAARFPVFMAEFFGETQEKSSGRVEIKEMEAPVFGAMLHFIYTDAVPELDEKPAEAATATATTTLAQHLLVCCR
jgi:speckle-type POZ protein